MHQFSLDFFIIKHFFLCEKYTNQSIFKFDNYKRREIEENRGFGMWKHLLVTMDDRHVVKGCRNRKRAWGICGMRHLGSFVRIFVSIYLRLCPAVPTLPHPIPCPTPVTAFHSCSQKFPLPAMSWKMLLFLHRYLRS